MRRISVFVCLVVLTGCGRQRERPATSGEKARRATSGQRAASEAARPGTGEPRGGAARPANAPSPGAARPSQEARTAPSGPETAASTSPRPQVRPGARPGGEAPPDAASAAGDESTTSLEPGEELPGRECVQVYKAGSAAFKANQYDRALVQLARYVQGRCVGRFKGVMDEWAAYRGAVAACKHPSHRYLKAFQELLRKVCRKAGSRSYPCRKGPECPTDEKSLGPLCRDLYNKGSAAFKANDMAGAYDTLLEFEKKGCFDRLTRTVWQWALYRGLVAAQKTGRPGEAFLAHAAQVCGNRDDWPCEKLRKLGLLSQ